MPKIVEEFPPFKHVFIEIRVDYEMMEGYLAGFLDEELELPDRLDNRSHCSKHGWLNGRDDRIGKPRDTATNLRLQAQEAYDNDNNN